MRHTLSGKTFVSFSQVEKPFQAIQWNYVKSGLLSRRNDFEPLLPNVVQFLELGGGRQCDHPIWTNIILIDDKSWKPVFEQYRGLLNEKSPHMEFQFAYELLPNISNAVIELNDYRQKYA